MVIIQKPFKELTDDVKPGHESFDNGENMYAKCSTNYKTKVKPESDFELIRFKLLYKK